MEREKRALLKEIVKKCVCSLGECGISLELVIILVICFTIPDHRSFINSCFHSFCSDCLQEASKTNQQACVGQGLRIVYVRFAIHRTIE